MAAKNSVEIELLLNNKSVLSGITKTDKAIDSVGTTSQKAASGIGKAFAAIGKAVAVLGVIKFFKDATTAASDLQEEINKFNVVFADVNEEAESFATNLQENFGQSELSARKLLSGTGDLLTGLGFTGEAALDLSNQVAQLSVDLASFQNLEGGAERAAESLTKALLGETESAKSLGIVIRQDTKEFRAQVAELQKSEGLTREQAKAQLILAQAFNQSKNAVGDFARSSGSFANTFKTLVNVGKDFLGVVGGELLPGLTALGQALISASKTGNPFLELFKNIFKVVGAVITGIAQLINVLSAIDAEGRAKEQDRIAKGQSLKAKRNIEFLKQEERELQDLKAQGGAADKKRIQALTQSIEERKKITLGQLNESLAANKKSNEYTDKAAAAQSQYAKTSAEFFAEQSQQSTGAAKKAVENIENITEKVKTEGGKQSAEQKKLAQEQAEYADKQYIDQLASLDIFLTEAGKKWGEYYDNITGLALQFTGMLSEIYQMSADNQIERINQQLEKQIERYDLEEERALENAGVAEQTAVQKAEAELSTLQAELAAETVAEKKSDLEKQILQKKDDITRLKIQEEYDKKREAAELAAEEKTRAIQRENAQIQKRINVTETIINGATAAISAYKALAGIPYVGPALGAAAAATVAGFTAKQVSLIQAQPLPLNTGGIVPGSGDTDTVPAVLTPGELVVPQEFTEEVLDRQAGGESGSMSVTVIIGDDTLYGNVQRGIDNGEITVRTEDLSQV